MNGFAERITLELNVLVGLPMTDCWRAADMQIFEFGLQEPFVNRKGESVTAGRFKLHVQCPWRLKTTTEILFSYQDLRDPADPVLDRQQFDWDQQPSLLDKKQRAWFARHRSAPLNVISAIGDSYGGCRIELDQANVLECVSFSTGPAHEYWRLIDGLVEGAHFVVTSEGIHT